jgi:hypothetical protein
VNVLILNVSASWVRRAMVTSRSESVIERWKRGFAALSKFRAREGHCCPSRHHVEGGYELGQWVSVQRYRKELLSVEHKRRLDEIGFVWDWRNDLWEQNFAALSKFKRREGHCRVPALHREGKHQLAYWVSTQRRNKSDMSAERKARLNKIGFVECGYRCDFPSSDDVSPIKTLLVGLGWRLPLPHPGLRAVTQIRKCPTYH